MADRLKGINYAVDENGVKVDVMCCYGGKDVSYTTTSAATQIKSLDGAGQKIIASFTPSTDVYFRQGISTITAAGTTSKRLKAGQEYVYLVEDGMDYMAIKAVATDGIMSLGYHGRRGDS